MGNFFKNFLALMLSLHKKGIIQPKLSKGVIMKKFSK